ncbi:MAG TPA: RNA 2',3'-cyclic phosphodiesterase [Solirubrobacterales bacterium]|jgi:2'-5' RNA ligase|nr:RNA 2',3'-cyclic phosphodiesterase [Solirubrobacterales bacterium]
MAKERLKSPRARLFIALDLPEEVKAGIWSWGDRALADPALRRIVPESLHITLAFLGWRPEKEVERLGEILAESVGPAPLVELRDPEPRPPRGRPRLFALPALSPGAELLQAGLQERLVEGHFYEPEKRPYWPHVTVARVRAEARGSKRPARVEKLPESLSAALAGAFLGVRLTLYRSELQPTGARYVPLAQVELPGAGRQ